MNRSSFFLIILVCFLKNQYVIAGSIQTDIEDFGSLIGLDASNELHYIIHEDIDLKGKTVRLPANSYLRITRGKLKNGVIILDNTTLKCKKGAFEDVTIRGTIKNKFFLR